MRLENYIHKNRKAFDNERPSDQLWAEIAQHLPIPERKVTPLWMTLSAAASVSILVVSGLLFAYHMGQKSSQSFTAEKMEVQAYYQNRLENELVKLAGMNVPPEVLRELQSFDTAMVVERPSNEKEKEAQLRAIIQNFETRLSIIEQHLELTNETNKQIKTSDDEKSI